MRRVQAYARFLYSAVWGISPNDRTTRTSSAEESDSSSGSHSEEVNGGLGWAGADHGATERVEAISGGAPAQVMNLMKVIFVKVRYSKRPPSCLKLLYEMTILTIA